MFKEKSISKILITLSLVLLLPALLIHLGMLAFIDDEGIRSLVALEMKYRNNYIVPTMNGNLYFSKPPLFNWILLVFFELSGRMDEFIARIPTIISTIGFAGTIFWYAKKYISRYQAFVLTMASITCGRMLFWDSMLSLIDVTYSWVTFWAIIEVYYRGQKQQWWYLFLITYFLSAIGFMLKGLPTFLFQGVTLIVWLGWKREFKRLFSLAHFAGVGLFLALVGAYYIAYIQQYQTIASVTGLVEQATMRTVLGKGIFDTVKHLFTFPFEMAYHFLPWSLAGILVLRRDILNRLKENEFIFFSTLIFLVNIPVYWSSPGVYPRYVLMLSPFIFAPFIYLYHHSERDIKHKIFEILLFFLGLIFTIGVWSPPFISRLDFVDYIWLKTIPVGVIMLFLLWTFWKYPAHRLLTTISILLAARIAFNFFVIPDRNLNDSGAKVRATSISIGKRLKDKNLYVYFKTDCQPANNYYMTREREGIVQRQMEIFPKDGYYIVDTIKYPDVLKDSLTQIYIRHNEPHTFVVGSLKE